MSSSGADKTRRWRIALATGVVAVVLVAVGRLEGDRRAESAVAGMARTKTAIGTLESPSLSGYRVLEDFDCLVYRRETNPFALELCIDGDGRVVETIERRGEDRRIHSLRDDPDASPLRVDRALVDRLLRMMGAPCCR